jgi:oligopeptide transport system permease protein
MVYESRYTDDYTSVNTVKAGFSKIGYSFVIGVIAVIISYLLGVPLGILMARKKDKLVDQIGTIYIVFIMAVPSLAYIFMFKALGGKLGLPTTFDMESSSKLMFILPIISLALPSIGSLMKWLRRYMIDQMNSDYVKFARSGGLTEGEIFSKHILKNAAIPIIHGIPGSVLGALTGAIITESVYVVPGAGNLLTQAIGKYDNGVIVGVTLFYAVLSVVSIILGDVLMAMVDPRISFSTKDR